MFCGEAMTTGNITRDILHRQIRVSKQMPEHPKSSIYQWTDNVVIIYRNNLGGVDPNRLLPPPTKIFFLHFCNYFFLWTKSLMASFIHVLRIRECQAFKGSIMWLTPLSRDLDWRLSFRSVTASGCVWREQPVKREEDWEDNSVYYYIFLQFMLMSV